MAFLSRKRLDVSTVTPTSRSRLQMTQAFLVLTLAAAAAASAAGGTCNASSTQCYANHDALYNETAMDSPEECCAACLADKRCASYTH